MLQQILDQFWYRHPALLYGLFTLIGACLALYPVWLAFYLFLAALLMLPAITLAKPLQNVHMRLALALCLALTSFYLTHSRYLFPPGEAATTGLAEVEMSAVSTSTSHFGTAWNYKATLLSFVEDNTHAQLIARNIPVRIILPLTMAGQRPQADRRYRIKGRLKDDGHNNYTLSPLKNASWQSLDSHFSLAEWRLTAKTVLKHHIQSHYSNQHVAAFLSGMATGEFDDHQLSFELGRFGLQHLMAISGLHFSLLAAFLGCFLCAFISHRLSALIVILLLSGYFLFLGHSASVLRAWMAITIALAGILLGKRSQALNSLGLAILVIALWNPLLIQSLAFQFSFGVTAAILLGYAPCDALMQKLFPKRTLSQVVDIGWLNQHAYCVLCFLRQGLALTLAVNLVALPLTLYHFHKFPLMSLAYNLFFPLMASFSMLLLLLALLVTPMPWVGSWLSSWLHAANEHYTQFLLNFTFHLPKAFDSVWYVAEIPATLLFVYLSLLFAIGILYKENTDRHSLSAPWIL